GSTAVLPHSAVDRGGAICDRTSRPASCDCAGKCAVRAAVVRRARARAGAARAPSEKGDRMGLPKRIAADTAGHALAFLRRASPQVISELIWLRHNLLYRGKREHLFLVSYPRSGNTLTQNLLY